MSIPRTIAVEPGDLLALLVNPIDEGFLVAFIETLWEDGGIPPADFADVVDTWRDLTVPDGVNAAGRAKIRAAMHLDAEPAIPCKVCGARPDEDGWIDHGRGCHVLSEDGGGSEYVGTRSTETP